MSSSFHTLEEGMRIILYLLFLQEPLAFPTSCSLQLHGRWARRRPKSSARCLRRPGLGLTSPWRTRLQTEGGVRGTWASRSPFIPAWVCKPLNLARGRGLHALICASLPFSFPCLSLSLWIFLSLIFSLFSHFSMRFLILTTRWKEVVLLWASLNLYKMKRKKGKDSNPLLRGWGDSKNRWWIEMKMSFDDYVLWFAMTLDFSCGACWRNLIFLIQQDFKHQK